MARLGHASSNFQHLMDYFRSALPTSRRSRLPRPSQKAHLRVLEGICAKLQAMWSWHGPDNIAFLIKHDLYTVYI